MKKIVVITIICLFSGLNHLSAQISIKKGEGGLWIMDGQKKAAFYQKDELSMNQESGRANFLHPLYLPDGTLITENAPPDHPHHRGVFWAWHQILINGRQICDSWALTGFKTDVRSVEFKRIESGNGVLESISDWLSPAWNDGQEPFLQETTRFTFFPQSVNRRLIRIDIQLKSLVDDLKLGGSDDEKGYGGFSVRMKLPDDIRFTAEGGEVEPQNTAIEAGPYINMTGSVGKNGSPGGMLIYAVPENQTTPQTWILRKKASMQNAVFPGHIPVQLKKNLPLKLSYYLVLYNGRISETKVVRELEKK
ncbi:MAG: DUF6807 family protein [Mangrovibacterium sp.]